MDFSTHSFNPELSKPRLFNHKLFHLWLFNPRHFFPPGLKKQQQIFKGWVWAVSGLHSWYMYRKVVSSGLVYSLGQRSQYISMKFPLYINSLRILGCATKPSLGRCAPACNFRVIEELYFTSRINFFQNAQWFQVGWRIGPKESKQLLKLLAVLMLPLLFLGKYKTFKMVAW